MSVRRDYWRLIVWNGTQRVGYAKLSDDGGLSFTLDWRAATTFSTKREWDETRKRLRDWDGAWSSTALNAPRTVHQETAMPHARSVAS